MRLVINNLRSRGPWMVRTWINVRLSYNHSSAAEDCSQIQT
jgi:hypothetical protein